MADTLNTESLLRLIAENTGKRVSLGLDDLDQYLSVARAAIAADRRKQAALQELVDIAQELDIGYGPSSAATKAAAPDDAPRDFLAHPAYAVACRMGNVLFNLMQHDDLPGFWRKKCRDLVAEWDAARRAASTPAVPGTGREKEDSARIDHLEAWREKGRSRGFEWDSYSFVLDVPIREQLDANRVAAPSHPLEAKAGEDA